MSSLRTKLVIAAAWFLFWGLMTVVAVIDYIQNGGTHVWQATMWEVSSALAGGILLIVQRHFMRAFDYLLVRPWRWLALQALWLPLHWLAFVPLSLGMRTAVYAISGTPYRHQSWLEAFVYETCKISLCFCMFMVVLIGILSYRELLEEKARAEQSNALLRQAQLQRMTQQMQPHFLFNALNTVSSLMHTDVEKADATLVGLADVLRATLDVSELHEAPLSTELRLVRGYAQVMSERFPDRVNIAWDIADDALPCSVPVMSLQPLLENIFKHTVERQRALTRIAIDARREAGSLLVRLADDRGIIATGEAAGIGLSNLRGRLAVLYGQAASLTLTQLQPAGVQVEMRLPCAS
jgi:two-component system LytT family sensor kinase